MYVLPDAYISSRFCTFEIGGTPVGNFPGPGRVKADISVPLVSRFPFFVNCVGSVRPLHILGLADVTTILAGLLLARPSTLNAFVLQERASGIFIFGLIIITDRFYF